MVRFVSEFGAQAVPSGDAAAFAHPERWPDLDWDELELRYALQKGVFDRHVPPEGYATFAGWRDATQRHQARVIRRMVEELRRLKYRPTGGFAQFLFADAQPGITWSVLDHERGPKLGHAALREACRPVIVVADRLPATVAPGTALALDVHVVSDLRAAVDGARVSARPGLARGRPHVAMGWLCRCGRLRAGRHDPGRGPRRRPRARGPPDAHARPRAPPAHGRGRDQSRRVPHHLAVSTAVSGVGTPETAVESPPGAVRLGTW